ncbi:helicase associated domain-containing protein [Streptomyces sp. NPDC058690]|uniref:helicase associated domain-containing protein n=1 Tax=Streptomyces sp. NPDC058690 TaxID=3346600 RepID=UPI00365DBEF7
MARQHRPRRTRSVRRYPIRARRGNFRPGTECQTRTTITITITATSTETAKPEPAPTVTKTRTVKTPGPTVTVTKAAQAAGSSNSHGSSATVAFDEGLAAAWCWAAEHGHLLAPTEATWQGYPVGSWLKNPRAAPRRTDSSKAGAQTADVLSAERRQELEDIVPARCPAGSAVYTYGLSGGSCLGRDALARPLQRCCEGGE